MNFTREPIIETIITPKEGFKLLVKCTKGGTSEEYSVDAVEVVSFGHSFFFRSLERPKSFLVPVSDYEIIEVKETRVILKSPGVEKAIKIGGGKVPAAGPQEPAAVEQRLEKKRERRRHRRRRGVEVEAKEEIPQPAPEEPPTPLVETPIEAPVAEMEPKIVAEEAAPRIRRLIPPPTQLISETLVKVRDAMIEAGDESAPQPEEEKPKAKAPRKVRRKVVKKEEEPLPNEGEAGEVKRIATEVAEPLTTYSTVDSTLDPPFGSDLF